MLHPLRWCGFVASNRVAWDNLRKRRNRAICPSGGGGGFMMVLVSMCCAGVDAEMGAELDEEVALESGLAS